MKQSGTSNRRKAPHMRVIFVEGKQFHYKVGRCRVNIKEVGGKNHAPFDHDVAGVSVSEWERGCQKRYSSITPANVAAWIKGNLL